jgi:hypothetical protein
MKTVNYLLAVLAFAFSSNFSQAQFEATTNNKAEFALISLADANYGDGDVKKDLPTQKAQSGAKIVSAFQEGMAITELNGKFGYINRQGAEVVLPRFEEARFFSNNYAAVKMASGWTFINKQGRRISNTRYDWVGTFSENGIAPVQIAGKWGFINEQGQDITGIKYDKIRKFNESGKALVRFNNQWFIVDEFGVETPASVDTKLSASLEQENVKTAKS